MWSPEAVYTNPLSGVQVVGREAIEQQFAGIFAESKGVKLEATTHSIDFISPSVAVENGSAKVMEADQVVEQSDYTAVYVKRDGKWLLDRVTEEDVIQVPSHYEQLKDLEWMVGHWVDQDDAATVVTDCNWSRNENFLIRTFAVQIGDNIDMSGMQIIGWDPAAKRIRSWVFDSDGGFGKEPGPKRTIAGRFKRRNLAGRSKVLGREHLHPVGRQHDDVAVGQSHVGWRTLTKHRRSQNNEGITES